jgi:hypothetical protein
MISIKGNKIYVTGRDERYLKRRAKELKMKPEDLLNQILREMCKRIRIIDGGIFIEEVYK